MGAKKAKSRKNPKLPSKSLARLTKYIDKDTLKFLTELEEFCNRLDAGFDA